MKIKVIEPFHFEIKYLDFFTEQGYLKNPTRFFKSFVDCLHHPKKLQLISNDEFLINKFLGALQFKLGNFFIYTCGDGEFDPKVNMGGLVIKEINKISFQEQTKLISFIKKSEYYHKLLIFINSEAIELNKLGKIDVIQVPNSAQIKKIFPSFYESSSPKLEWKRLDSGQDISFDDDQDEDQLESDNGNAYKQHPYQFVKRENNKIKIVYDGKDIALRNEGLIGLHYLRLIIKYGINGISHKELESYYYNNVEESKTKKKLNTENSYQGKDDEKIISSRILEESITYKVVDEKTIRSIKRDIKDLKEEAKILENELRTDEADEVNQKIKELIDNISKYKDVEGEIRKFDTDSIKRKRRVKKAYNGAMKQIREDDLDFYLNLAKTIDGKKDPNKYFYVPQTNIDWILD